MTYGEKVDALTEYGPQKFSTWEFEFVGDMIILLEDCDDEDAILSNSQKEKIDEIYEKVVEGD